MTIETSKKDFSKEYLEQKKKMAPYSWIMILTVASIIFVFPLLFFLIEFGETFFFWYIVVSIILICISFWGIMKHNKCPNCKKYMPGDSQKFCTFCGAIINK
jgi:L-asparagine transporter-like permease